MRPKEHWLIVANPVVSRVVALGLAAAIFANSQAISRPADELGAIAAAARASERPEIRALSAALLYRADPVKWGSELSSTFSIHDYAPRARGEANHITQQEFISRIKDLESYQWQINSTMLLDENLSSA